MRKTNNGYDHALKFIRLGHSLENFAPSLSNGPGWRIALWTQGCSIRCTDRCLNPDFQASEGGFLYKAFDAATLVINAAKDFHQNVEGVTVIGGEPTDQAEQIALFLEEIRRFGLSTMVYSGHTFDHLCEHGDSHIQRLLEVTDLLVDGEFRENEYDDELMWRGSTNQKIHCISSRYTQEALFEAYAMQKKSFSLLLGPDGGISLSGLQKRSES